MGKTPFFCFRSLAAFLWVFVAAWVTPASAVVGDLQLWMPAGEPVALRSYAGEAWVASTRGLYAFHPTSLELRKRYASNDGLVGASVAVLAEVEEELIAVASSGEVMRYSFAKKRFDLVNTAWAASGYLPTAGVSASRGRYLFFASGHRLVIYDARKDRTELTLERLSGGAVQEIHAESDGLWILLDSAFWRAPFNWDSLSATRDSSGRWFNHSDPAAWSKVSLLESPPYRSVKRLKTGSWQADSAPQKAEVEIGGALFLLDSGKLCKKQGNAKHCVALSGDDVDGVRLLALDPDGSIWGWGEPWFWNYSEGAGWERAFSYNAGIAATNGAILERWVRPLSIDGRGRWITGSWGKGVMLLSADGSKEKWLVPESGEGCPEAFSAIGDASQPSFVVVPTVVGNGEGALFAWWRPSGAKTYGLGWWDGSQIICKTMTGSDEPYTLVADPLEERTFWMLHAVGLQRLAIAPRLASLSKQGDYPSGMLGSMTGLAVDALGRKWVSGTGGIGVICDEQAPTGICTSGETDTLVRADLWLGLPQTLYSVIRHDGHGHLWIGTWGEGLIRLDVSAPDLRRAGVTRWTRREGLPSDEIFDIAPDPLTGVVWISTSQGIVRLESLGRNREQFNSKNPPGLYPNPFYPERDPFVRFDRLPPSAQVALYSRSGRLIQRWRGEALSGGLLEWDGRDPSGTLLQSGVYNWVVSAPSGTWKGRLLLVR